MFDLKNKLIRASLFWSAVVFAIFISDSLPTAAAESSASTAIEKQLSYGAICDFIDARFFYALSDLYNSPYRANLARPTRSTKTVQVAGGSVSYYTKKDGELLIMGLSLDKDGVIRILNSNARELLHQLGHREWQSVYIPDELDLGCETKEAHFKFKNGELLMLTIEMSAD